MARYSTLKIRFFRNVGYKTIADFISRLATLVITVYLARQLSQEQFGSFSYTLALATAWALLLDFGWNNVVIRSPDQDWFSRALLGTAALKLMVFLGVVAMVSVGGIFLPRNVTWAGFVFCFFYAGAMSFQEFQGAMIARMERFDLEWVTKLIPRWAPFLVLVLFLPSNRTSEGAAVFLGVTSLGITLAATAWLFYKFLNRPAQFIPSDLIRVLKDGAPFGLAAVLWGVYTRLDVILLGLYGFGLDQIGIYAAAVKVVDFFRGVGFIVYMAMIPIFNDDRDDPARLWRIVVKIALMFSLLVVMAVPAIWFGSPLVMKWVYGASYQSGAKPLALALLGVSLFIINTPFLAALTSLGKGRMSLLGSVLMLLACFSINARMLPSHGLLAPALAIVGAELVWLVANAAFLKNRLAGGRT